MFLAYTLFFVLLSDCNITHVNYNGVRDVVNALPRSHLVSALFNIIAVENERSALITAPPASGKTSLLQLLSIYCADKGITCIYVSMSDPDFKEKLKAATGLIAGSWTLERGGLCDDPTRLFVVMLDGVHEQYGDGRLWFTFVRPNPYRDLPANIRFVLSATHPLCGNLQTPVTFSALSRLNSKEFRLSDEEVGTILQDAYSSRGIEDASKQVSDPVVKDMIAGFCNGHVGSLAVSIGAMREHFGDKNTASIAEIVEFYLSSGMFIHFERCYGQIA